MVVAVVAGDFLVLVVVVDLLLVDVVFVGAFVVFFFAVVVDVILEVVDNLVVVCVRVEVDDLLMEVIVVEAFVAIVELYQGDVIPVSESVVVVKVEDIVGIVCVIAVVVSGSIAFGSSTCCIGLEPVKLARPRVKRIVKQAEHFILN